MPWLILFTLASIAVGISLLCGSKKKTSKSGEGSRHSQVKDAVGAPSAPPRPNRSIKDSGKSALEAQRDRSTTGKEHISAQPQTHVSNTQKSTDNTGKGLAKTQETVTKKSEEKIQKRTTETIVKTEIVKKTDTIIATKETMDSPQGTGAHASNYSQRFHSQEWFTEKEPRRRSADLRVEETQLFTQPTECSSKAD